MRGAASWRFAAPRTSNCLLTRRPSAKSCSSLDSRRDRFPGICGRMPVYLIATLDTKGIEAAFVREQLTALGVPVLVIDAGCQGTPAANADVTREEVFEAAGTSLAEMQRRGDRGVAVTNAAKGVGEIIRRLDEEGRVSGVLGLGGSAGTTVGTAAMRVLPIGVPKLMIS